jgi:membrane associated rhomboid family serine protease
MMKAAFLLRKYNTIPASPPRNVIPSVLFTRAVKNIPVYRANSYPLGGLDDKPSQSNLEKQGLVNNQPARTAPTTSSSLDIHRPNNNIRALGNGTFTLLLINFGIYLAGPYFPSLLQNLFLHHNHPQWWQFITAAFCHANWEHLSGNAFSLLIFGKVVEEEEGALGVWMTYLVCGAFGNVASWLSAPGAATISLGASGAVFGLFAVGVLVKLKFSIRRLLEAFILGLFVAKQVMSEVAVVSSGKVVSVGGMTVGNWAHLGGAIAGVILVLVLSRISDDGGGE